MKFKTKTHKIIFCISVGVICYSSFSIFRGFNRLDKFSANDTPQETEEVIEVAERYKTKLRNPPIKRDFLSWNEWLYALSFTLGDSFQGRLLNFEDPKFNQEEFLKLYKKMTVQSKVYYIKILGIFYCSHENKDFNNNFVKLLHIMLLDIDLKAIYMPGNTQGIEIPIYKIITMQHKSFLSGNDLILYSYLQITQTRLLILLTTAIEDA